MFLQTGHLTGDCSLAETMLFSITIRGERLQENKRVEEYGRWGIEGHGRMRDQRREKDQRRTRNHKKKGKNHKRWKKNYKRRKKNHRRKKRNHNKKEELQKMKKNHKRIKRNHRRKKVYYRAGSKSKGCIVIIYLFHFLLSNSLLQRITLNSLLLFPNLSCLLFWSFIVVVFIDNFLGNFRFIIIMPVQTETPFTNCTISIILDFKRPSLKNLVNPMCIQIVVRIGVVIRTLFFSSFWLISFSQLLVIW